MLVRLLDRELYESDLHEDRLVPRHIGDAGVDLRSRHDVRVHAGVTEKVPLGVAVAIPQNAVGWVTGRSYTALMMGLFVHEGKIDSGYTGEVHCFVTATGSPVEIRRGDRLCQIVELHIGSPAWSARAGGYHGWPVTYDELPESDRGEHGLGSTGRR